MSVALPGWGHLYLRRRVLAACELGIGLILLALAISRLVIVFLDVIEERAATLEILWVCFRWSAVLIGYSVADGLFTLLVSRGRLEPAEPPAER